MKNYPLKVGKSSQLFDMLSIDKTLLLCITCFFMALCAGIIYFGRSSSALTFCCVLSIYAGLLGFVIARLVINFRLENRNDHHFLTLLSKNQLHTDLIIDISTLEILFQNHPFENNPLFINKNILAFIESLELHPLDRSKILSFIEAPSLLPFSCVIQRKQAKNKAQWLAIQAYQSTLDEKEIIVFKLEDITSEKHTSLTQHQYIRDMERIIQNHRKDTPLHLLGQMASAQNVHRPLQTIQTYVQLIERDYQNKLDRKGQSYVQQVSSSTYQLKTMIEDLFSITGIDLDSTKMEMIDLNVLLQEVLHKLEKEVVTSDAQIRTTKMPTIWADQNQLFILFQNLIENAINYCGSQPPKIELAWYQHDTHWVFRVSDQGMGISQQLKKDIFKLFNRGQIITGIKGIGMGLPICRQIVHNHKGEIWVESDGPTKGCTIAFSIPLDQREVKQYKREQVGQPMAVSA